ncbi:MarR family transcriptional regulator [Streptomyces luteocolor]|uniref:MarR family transcriptional regulator n=2 Tax=Streptomyces TaxID=1883 RepID=UPI000AAF15ED|nr:MarR family transcriptional regulator [Streptomyces luteocolor]
MLAKTSSSFGRAVPRRVLSAGEGGAADMATGARGRLGGQQELWRQLLLLVNGVGTTLDKKLQRQHGITASEFTALSILGGGRLRMQELADSVGLSQSTMSRLVGRLEGAGLAARTAGEEDRRVMFAQLTEEGKKLVARAQGTFSKELELALDVASFEPATASLVNRLRHDPTAR